MPESETDLVALVIELEAAMETYIDNHLGRAIQWVALTMLSDFDADLAQTLHNADDLKPFTISGLMRNNALLYGDIRTGDRAWIRFTGLSAEVAKGLQAFYEQVQTELKAGQPRLIELDRIPWRVTAIHCRGTAWAGSSSYQTLIDRQTNARPQHHLTLNFITPTTFRSQTVNMPLPLPHLVFGSLLSRWVAFTPHRLRDLPQDQLDMFIAHHVMISQHDMKTAMLRGKQGGKEIGFTGRITYEFAPKSDHLLKHNPELEEHLQREYAWFARTLGLLADFAFYSSIGRKTTTGMGLACDGKISAD